MSSRAALRVGVVTADGDCPAWLTAALAPLVHAQQVRVVAVARISPATPDTREHWQCRLQRLLETRIAANDRRLTLARAFPLATSPLGSEVDVVLAWGVDPSVALPFATRLGTLVLELGGTADALGGFRALVHGQREVAIVAWLATGEKRTALAHGVPALPEHPTLLTQEAALHSRVGVVMAKALRGLAAGRHLTANEPVLPSAPAPAGPGQHLAFLAQRARQSLEGRWSRLWKSRYWLEDENNWFLAYRTTPEAFVCNQERFSANGFRLVLPPAGRFYADPCVLHHGGRDHVFFEEWRQETNRGVVAFMTLGDDDQFTAPEMVLEEPHHLSYPFVFEADGEAWMIPETAAAGRVDLYCATDFPRGWEKAGTLLEGVNAADTTVHRQDGKWWMFTTIGEAGTSRNDQLCIFHAETLTGPWHAHAENPVKIDAASSRPGGRLFRRGGRLVRPSQDCIEAYGSALTLNEVTLLTPERFEERVIERIGPGWLSRNVGLHTVSHGRRVEVIDGRIRSREARFPDMAEWVRQGTLSAPANVGAAG